MACHFGSHLNGSEAVLGVVVYAKMLLHFGIEVKVIHIITFSS